MQSVTLHSRVGADGILNLQIPVALKDVEVEVIVTLRALEQPELEALAQSNGWPAGFFTNIIGGWQGDPPAREPQGDYEVRPSLSPTN